MAGRETPHVEKINLVGRVAAEFKGFDRFWTDEAFHGALPIVGVSVQLKIPVCTPDTDPKGGIA